MAAKITFREFRRLFRMKNLLSVQRQVPDKFVNLGIKRAISASSSRLLPMVPIVIEQTVSLKSFETFLAQSHTGKFGTLTGDLLRKKSVQIADAAKFYGRKIRKSRGRICGTHNNINKTCDRTNQYIHEVLQCVIVSAIAVGVQDKRNDHVHMRQSPAAAGSYFPLWAQRP